MKISVDYEQLEAAAREFSQHADQTGSLYSACQRLVDGLRGNGWIGQGATAFYGEMDELVFPALAAMENALHETHNTLVQVIASFRDMEEEAAHVFNQTEAEASSTYTIRSGDTLGAIAQRYGTTVEALAAANNISNRNLIYAGQQLVIPGAGVPVNPPAPPTIELPKSSPAFTPQQYDTIINGLNVESNPSYAKFRDGNPETYDTYCNLFAAHVADKMHAPLPLYVTSADGSITKWLGATNMREWLEGRLSAPGQYTQGPENGWKGVDTATAVQYANQGYFTVAAGHGHIAVVRPGNDPAVNTPNVVIAQAGENNFNQGPLSKGWGGYVNEVQFFVHLPR